MSQLHNVIQTNAIRVFQYKFASSMCSKIVIQMTKNCIVYFNDLRPFITEARLALLLEVRVIQIPKRDLVSDIF